MGSILILLFEKYKRIFQVGQAEVSVFPWLFKISCAKTGWHEMEKKNKT